MVGFTKEARDAAKIAFKKNSAVRKQKLIDDYLKSPKFCGRDGCDNALNYAQAKDGVKFCCRSCSNSAVKRLASEASREKVSRALSKPPRTEWKCSQCQSLFTSLIKRTVCSEDCYRAARVMGSRRAVETMRRNGTFSGWHNRRFEPSYPERYFMSVFENEGVVGWEREKKVGRWFIDFAFPSKMLAVEIDGRQHEDTDRKKRDEEKDKYLIDSGWKVIRIKWKNPKNEKGRQFLHPQVKALLEEIGYRERDGDNVN